MRRQYRGQAVVIIAILMVVMMGAIALSIDVSRVQMEQTRVQRAADEAAIAGLTAYKLSPNATGEATAIALTVQDIVNRNMTQIGLPNVKVSDALSVGITTKLTVHVSEDSFPLSFGSALGIGSVHLDRSSAAQSNSPVQLGNPGPVLGCGGVAQTIQGYRHVAGKSGADQGTPTPLLQPYCLAVDGPENVTENGDPYSPINLVSGGTSPVVTIANPWRQRTNFDGYDYQVVVPGTGSSFVTYIQVYDAGTCPNSTTGDTIASSPLFGLPNAQPTSTPSTATLDNWRTYYRLYQLDPAGNKMPLAGSNATPYPLLQGPHQAQYSDVVIDPGSGRASAPNCNPLTSLYFGRWYTVARVVDSTSPAMFDMNVSTCLRAISGDCNGTEQNNYGIRVISINAVGDLCNPSTFGQVPGSNGCQSAMVPSGAQPIVSAVQRESISVNAPTQVGNASTQLFLANVPANAEGHWLAIHLFDPRGDTGSSGPIIGSSIQIVRPNGSYAPFEWTSELADGNGTPLATTAENNLSSSLVTTFPSNGSGPAYATPLAGTCPSGDTSVFFGISPVDSEADGQTVAEDNPFDPLHNVSGNCAQGGFVVTPAPSYASEPNLAPTPSWFSGSSYKNYNLNPNQGSSSAVYQPYRGRWVTLYTQVPSGYAAQVNASNAAYSGYWYLNYTASDGSGNGASFSDRMTMEVIDISSSPKIIPVPVTDTPTSSYTPLGAPTATSTNTNTPIPPTATSTNTPIPPTAANTVVGAPTATNTNSPIPPTNTPIPHYPWKMWRDTSVASGQSEELIFTLDNTGYWWSGNVATVGTLHVTFSDPLAGRLAPSNLADISVPGISGSSTFCTGQGPGGVTVSKSGSGTGTTLVVDGSVSYGQVCQISVFVTYTLVSRSSTLVLPNVIHGWYYVGATWGLLNNGNSAVNLTITAPLLNPTNTPVPTPTMQSGYSPCGIEVSFPYNKGLTEVIIDLYDAFLSAGGVEIHGPSGDVIGVPQDPAYQMPNTETCTYSGGIVTGAIDFLAVSSTDPAVSNNEMLHLVITNDGTTEHFVVTDRATGIKIYDYTTSAGGSLFRITINGTNYFNSW